MGTARKFKYKDGEYTIAELAVISDAGVSEGTIRMRLRYGWSVDMAVEIPNKKRKGKDDPICGAKSWKDCFSCRFNDCIANNIYFKDNPFLDNDYLWR